MNKLLFDFFPLVLFFIAFKFADIYVATKVAILCSVLQLVWLKVRGRRIEAINWMNVIIIGVFGGATIYLHDDTFVKWKPTVLYWLFAVILIGSRWLMKKNMMRKLLGEQMKLPDRIWDRLSDTWAGFFLFSGLLNLYVAFSGHFTQDQWVTFKAFGMMILLVIFAIAQSVWLGRHMQELPTASQGNSLPEKSND